MLKGVGKRKSLKKKIRTYAVPVTILFLLNLVILPTVSAQVYQSIPSYGVVNYSSLSGGSTYIVGYFNSTHIYAMHGINSTIVYLGKDVANIINSVISDMPSNGGTIFIKSGTYSLSSKISLTGRRDPLFGSIQLVGEAFSKGTYLRYTGTDTDSLLDLSGSSHMVFRDITFDGNNRVDYVIKMQRDVGGEAAGNHVFENVFALNGKKASALIYGAENVYMNNFYGLRSSIGLLVTAYPPKDDPTIINQSSVDFLATCVSTLGTTLINCKLGSGTITNKASLIIAQASVRMFAGMLQTALGAEANVIIDESRYQSIFLGTWIDTPNANIGFKIGSYSSAYKNMIVIESVHVSLYGAEVISALNTYSSVILGITTSRSNAFITLGTTTQNNFIAGCTIINGTPLTIIDNGINNTILNGNTGF